MLNASLVVIGCAVLPAIVLLYFIHRMDKVHPEPTSMMVKGVLYGVLSIGVSLTLSLLLSPFYSYGLEGLPLFGSAYKAFYLAALPEETAKLFMLWLLLRRNPYFDERMDGIVYAVCIGLGFAAFENVQYLFSAGDDFLNVAISRALFAVPGHYAFAVAMGYFYSLVHFDNARYGKYRVLIWLVPFLLHGIYDTICFAMEELPELSGVITIGLYYFCYRMHKTCIGRIRRMQFKDKDQEDIRIFTEAMRKG